MTIFVKDNIEKISEIATTFKDISDSVIIKHVEITYDWDAKKYMAVIRPWYEDQRIEIKGFKKIDGTCKTCFFYGGASTHYFGRGWVGNCYKTDEETPIFHQCEYYKDKKEMIEEARKEAQKLREEKEDRECDTEV